MNSWVALFKALNVGGNNIVPMKQLVAMFTGLGYADAKSYIQSGNVIFRSNEKDALKLSEKINQALRAQFGVQSPTLIVSRNRISQVLDANPFAVSDDEANLVHLFFLYQPAKQIDQVRLETVRKSNERCALLNDVFYLHAPDGVGKSKLAGQVEKVLGVTVTARNLRTVRAIHNLAEQSD